MSRATLCLAAKHLRLVRGASPGSSKATDPLRHVTAGLRASSSRTHHFPACGRPRGEGTAGSTNNRGDAAAMASLPKGEGAEELIAQSCAALGACSRYQSSTNPPIIETTPRTRLHRAPAFLSNSHRTIKHQTHHSNLSPPSIQGYPQAEPGGDPDATQGCAHVDPGPARRRHLQKVHRQELEVRRRLRQPTFNRRGRRRASPGRALDQLEGRRGRREHARHLWVVTARLCPGGQAGHDRRHVLTEVASRERGVMMRRSDSIQLTSSTL